MIWTLNRIARNPFLLFVSILLLFVGFKLWVFSYGRAFFDEGIYVAMSSYFATAGSAGFFEMIRPFFVPVILIPTHFVPGFRFIVARMIVVLVTVLCMIALYVLIKRIADKKTALLVSLLYATSTLVLTYSGYILTDVLAAHLLLISLLLCLQAKPVWGGAVFGLSFLCKFPMAIGIVPLLCIIFVNWRLHAQTTGQFFRQLCSFLIATTVIISPFFLFHVMHGSGTVFQSMVAPLHEASGAVFLNWQFQSASPVRYAAVLLSEIPILIGLGLFFWKRIRYGKSSLDVVVSVCFLTAALFFTYLSYAVPRFDERYAIFFLVPLIIPAARGIAMLQKKWLMLLSCLIICYSAVFIISAVTPVVSTMQPPVSDQTLYTNTGYALFEQTHASVVIAHSHLGMAAQAWLADPSSDIFALDIDGYPCQALDAHCIDVRDEYVARLAASAHPIACGYLFGDRVIVLSKTQVSSHIDCPFVLPQSKHTQHVVVRISDFSIETAQPTYLSHLRSAIVDLQADNVSVILTLLPARFLAPEAASFLQDLPPETILEKVVESAPLADRYDLRLLNRTITSVKSDTDDFTQFDDIPHAQFCTRGGWDDTSMPMDCLGVSVYATKRWDDPVFRDDLAQQIRIASLYESRILIDAPSRALIADHDQVLVQSIHQYRR